MNETKQAKQTMRLDKFLTEMGMGSRSQIKEAARKGKIAINGSVCKKPETRINLQTDEVIFDGRPVSYVELEYYMLHKPQGVVSATEDNRYPTVLDLIPNKKRKDLFPVGRLDLDTEGLLLITNDGDLAHRLLAPKKHVDKVYEARLEGTLALDAAAQFAAGITLTDGTQTLPAYLEILDSPNLVRLTIHEGKFHQVKRMFEALGCRVVYLKRLSMGSLVLDETLKPGESRPLTEKEIQALYALGDTKAQREIKSKGECRMDYLKGKKAVIFDLDGTLVDSMWMWKAIDIDYLGRYGYDCPDDLQKAIEGMGFTETAEYFKARFQIPDSIAQIKADWEAMSLQKYQEEVPLKPGALAFLQFLRAEGIRMGIATSNGRAMVDAVLESLAISHFFQNVTTACEVAHGKPEPDIYLKVAEHLGVKPEECLVFEDVPAGILAGKRAGMQVIAVKDDFSLEMDDEKRELADAWIADYAELTEERTAKK